MIECPQCKRVLVNSTYEEWAKVQGFKKARRCNLSDLDHNVRGTKILCDCGLTNLFLLEGRIEEEKNAKQTKD